MEIKYLRIGSLLLKEPDGEEIVKLTGIWEREGELLITHKGQEDFVKCDLTPVPLKKEYLGKVRSLRLHSDDSFDLKANARSFTAERYNPACFKVYHNGTDIGIVCALHSLQNLILSITGEELRFNF